MSKLQVRSCLIAEDEPIIALDLEDGLLAAGYEPRWFASMDQALWSLERNVPDVAIVDVHLRDGPCTELARALKRLGVPFIVHSGLSADARPNDLMDVPWVAKPAELGSILRALEAVQRRGFDQAHNPLPIDPNG